VKRGRRFYFGISLLVFNVAAYGATALMPLLGLPTADAAAMAGILILTAEAAFLASVALLGKPFFESLKTWVRRRFARPAPVAPATPISRARHITGVSLFAASAVPYLASEWILILGTDPQAYGQWPLALLLASDTLFVISFFVLGGEFWARVERCFAWPGPRPGCP